MRPATPSPLDHWGSRFVKGVLNRDALGAVAGDDSVLVVTDRLDRKPLIRCTASGFVKTVELCCLSPSALSTIRRLG